VSDVNASIQHGIRYASSNDTVENVANRLVL